MLSSSLAPFYADQGEMRQTQSFFSRPAEEQQAILVAMRKQAPVIVLLLRTHNSEIREAKEADYQQKMAEREVEKKEAELWQQ